MGSSGATSVKPTISCAADWAFASTATADGERCENLGDVGRSVGGPGARFADAGVYMRNLGEAVGDLGVNIGDVEAGAVVLSLPFSASDLYIDSFG